MERKKECSKAKNRVLRNSLPFVSQAYESERNPPKNIIKKEIKKNKMEEVEEKEPFPRIFYKGNKRWIIKGHLEPSDQVGNQHSIGTVGSFQKAWVFFLFFIVI